MSAVRRTARQAVAGEGISDGRGHQALPALAIYLRSTPPDSGRTQLVRTVHHGSRGCRFASCRARPHLRRLTGAAARAGALSAWGSGVGADRVAGSHEAGLVGEHHELDPVGSAELAAQGAHGTIDPRAAQ